MRKLSRREKEELGEASVVVAFSWLVSAAAFFVLLTPSDAVWGAVLLLAISVAAFALTSVAMKLTRR